MTNLYAYLASGVGIVAGVIFLYNKAMSAWEQRVFEKQKAASDEKQQEYSSEVDELTKEIKDAKLTFDINKRKLDSDKQ